MATQISQNSSTVPCSSTGAKKPLSAYNIFFQLERENIIIGQEDSNYTPDNIARTARLHHEKRRQGKAKRKHRRSHGVISFKELARKLADKWKKLDDSVKDLFEEQAAIEKANFVAPPRVTTVKTAKRKNNPKEDSQSPIGMVVAAKEESQPPKKQKIPAALDSPKASAFEALVHDMLQADVSDADLKSLDDLDLGFHDVQGSSHRPQSPTFPPKFIEVHNEASDQESRMEKLTSSSGSEASSEHFGPRRVSMYGSEAPHSHWNQPQTQYPGATSTLQHQISMDSGEFFMPGNFGRSISGQPLRVYYQSQSQQHPLDMTGLGNNAQPAPPAVVSSSVVPAAASRCRVRFNRIDASTGKVTGSTYFSKTRKETLQQLREKFDLGVPAMNPFRTDNDAEAEAIRNNQKYFQISLEDDTAEWDAWKDITVEVLAEASVSRLDLTIELKDACC